MSAIAFPTTPIAPAEDQPTHYVPFFVDAGRGYVHAVCGWRVENMATEHSTEPTCSKCREWLEADAAECERIRKALDEEFPEHLISR